MGLSWWVGDDDFGKFIYHDGNTEESEAVMRHYPDLELGVVVMSSVNGSQVEKIADALVSAWQHEK